LAEKANTSDNHRMQSEKQMHHII